MDPLTPIQITGIAIECALTIAGIVAWIRLSRRESRPLSWGAPLTDTLMLAWAVLFGAFLGQIAGAALLKMLPESTRTVTAVQVIVIGGLTDVIALVAWLATHAFLLARGQRLPPASETPFTMRRAWAEGGAAFLRALPLVFAVGLAWGILLRSMGLPAAQQDIVDLFEKTKSVPALAGLTVLATVIAPIVEELVFRAGIFRILGAKIGRWPAMTISSTLFALLHGSWLGFAPLFCLGVLFCLTYERSRNIAVPMIMHGLFNLNSILLIVIRPPDFL